MQSNAKTVPEYLSSLPDDRKKVMVGLRKTIKKNLPAGFEETMMYGMISYVVPLKLYAKGYHVTPNTPLPFLSIASQKNHISVYHMALYKGGLLDWFLDEWKTHTTKKLDMGKSCIRFRKPDDVPVELFGALASRLTPAQWIAIYEDEAKRK